MQDKHEKTHLVTVTCVYDGAGVYKCEGQLKIAAELCLV